MEHTEQNLDVSEVIHLLQSDSNMDQGKAEGDPENYLHDYYSRGMDAYWGLDGEKPDVTAAREWFRKAADLGHAPSQEALGFCCTNAEDYAEAAEWYRKAAEQGYSEAQAKLGYCCLHGRGVEKDTEQAIFWWRKAAVQGHRLAQTWLDELTK